MGEEQSLAAVAVADLEEDHTVQREAACQAYLAAAEARSGLVLACSAAEAASCPFEVVAASYQVRCRAASAWEAGPASLEHFGLAYRVAQA